MSGRVGSFGLAAAIFSLDRATKHWINDRVTAFDNWPIIPGYFNIIHSENYGMAFSLLADAPGPLRSFLLVGVSGAVLAFVAWLLWTWTGGWSPQRIALSVVLGGAAGNICDRIVRGSVTDFLDVHVGEYHWPTFNVADAAITTGALMIFLDLLLNPERRR